MKSGIMNLPMILSVVVFSLIGGVLVTTFGQYAPYMIASSVFMSVGAGLLSTFKVNTGPGEWIGYQILLGLGVGIGMQQALVAPQVVLPRKDTAIGVSIIMFMQTNMIAIVDATMGPS